MKSDRFNSYMIDTNYSILQYNRIIKNNKNDIPYRIAAIVD